MYRKQIAKKTSPYFPITPINKKTIPTPIYGSLSGTIQRAVANPETLREDEWLQLHKTIGTKATNEIKSGKRTSWVPEFKGIFAQLGGDWGQVSEPIQTKEKDEVNESEDQPALKKRWEQEDIGISAQLGGDSGQVDTPRQKMELEKVGESEAICEKNTGLPEELKVEVENKAGYSLEDVRVHYNSPKPAQLQALAYTQGTEIHVAPGQEEHLPHEAWHVVQQKQGRVKPTKQIKGIRFNDDERLEKEAEVMGRRTGRKHQSPLKPKRTAMYREDSAMPIQKVERVYIEDIEYTGDMVAEVGQQVFNRVLNEVEKRGMKIKGDVWFNSLEELHKYIKKGKVEGIGEWKGLWINFAEKGPCVIGEEKHSYEKYSFMKAINISHWLVEGKSERSIVGQIRADIPGPSKVSQSHTMRKYRGDNGGMALENYWLRAAQGLTYYWNELSPNLKKVDRNEPETISKLSVTIAEKDALEELIETVTRYDSKSRRMQLEEKQEYDDNWTGRILDELAKAQDYIFSAIELGLSDYLKIMSYTGAQRKREVIYWIEELGEEQKQKTREMGKFFSLFSKAIQMLAHYNYIAIATKEELAYDEKTSMEESPLIVWGTRREYYMLKNIEDALKESPPPKMIVMGDAHVKNRKKQLNELIGKDGEIIEKANMDKVARIGHKRKSGARGPRKRGIKKNEEREMMAPSKWHD